MKQFMKETIQFTGYLIPAILLVGVAFAEETPKDYSSKIYSPYTNQSYPTNVFFGDTHVHTNLSFDAYNFGNRNVGPEEAYRFAKGETVLSSQGMKARISRPLDFLVIADHATNMGVMQGLEIQDPNLLNSEVGKSWAPRLKEINAVTKIDTAKPKVLSEELFHAGFLQGIVAEDEYLHSVWKSAIVIADKYNDPGKFTALIGYEWTQMFNMLHRVVIFKDGADKVGNITPFSQYDSTDPEDLWRFLENHETNNGGEVLVIPHSGDVTTGTMFALENAKGQPLSKHYAKIRSRWEPLYEVTQMLGDSETHPYLSPNDEFADYETFTSTVDPYYQKPEFLKNRQYTHYSHWAKKHQQGGDVNWRYRYEYARSALKLGLEQQAKLKINPFKFGMIGSTDTHSGLSTPDEKNFWSKGGEGPNSTRMLFTGQRPASGYAAVWAEENPRKSLFAAMKRKETYATTGKRMTVRFFGGWDYQTSDVFKPDLARTGYSKGVPMGGDLTNAPKGKAPNFLIRAVKDPDGANLDRVQVIKGWHDRHGELNEKIYNVALSDGRQESLKGKVKPVGSTVDIPDASYTNSIGDPELAVVWQDPDFDKDELAFYYLRVLEIPTPRWTAYDAKFFGIKDIPEEVLMVTQERAYTSPIWFSPLAQAGGVRW